MNYPLLIDLIGYADVVGFDPIGSLVISALMLLIYAFGMRAARSTEQEQ